MLYSQLLPPQFGTKPPQKINGSSAGFGQILWDTVKLNSNPDIFEVSANEIDFKRGGNYQFTTNIALKRKNNSGQSRVIFQFFLDNEPISGEFYEEIHLTQNVVTFLSMSAILKIPNGSSGVLTIGVKLGRDGTVDIHEFTSILNAMRACVG